MRNILCLVSLVYHFMRCQLSMMPNNVSFKICWVSTNKKYEWFHRIILFENYRTLSIISKRIYPKYENHPYKKDKQLKNYFIWQFYSSLLAGFPMWLMASWFTISSPTENFFLGKIIEWSNINNEKQTSCSKKIAFSSPPDQYSMAWDSSFIEMGFTRKKLPTNNTCKGQIMNMNTCNIIIFILS